MNAKLKIILYGAGIFGVYIILLVILRLTSGRIPEDAVVFGLFSTSDLFLGLVVALVLTFTHVRKKRLK